MSLRQDVKELLEMHSAGGMIVFTTSEGTAVSATTPTLDETYDGKVIDQSGIRTTIQLDANTITIVSTNLINRADIWQKHATAVDERLALIERIRHWIRQSWLLFLAFPLLRFASDLRLLQEPADLVQLLPSTLLIGLLVVARSWITKNLAKFVGPWLVKLVVPLIKRRFDSFISTERQ